VSHSSFLELKISQLNRQITHLKRILTIPEIDSAPTIPKITTHDNESQKNIFNSIEKTRLSVIKKGIIPKYQKFFGTEKNELNFIVQRSSQTLLEKNIMQHDSGNRFLFSLINQGLSSFPLINSFCVASELRAPNPRKANIYIPNTIGTRKSTSPVNLKFN
jgi:hypothetical protein